MAIQERKLKSRKGEELSSEASGITGGPPLIETGGILTIDLDAIIANWRSLAERASPAECAAVVKADAYGCGLREVAVALAKTGCKTFFVAHIHEGRALREIAGDATIYVLNGVAAGSASCFAAARLRPVIGTLAELIEWDAFCGAHGWTDGAALHFDTGMNRLGIPMEEAPALSTRMASPNHGITLLMSHFACADAPEHPLNARQVQLFSELRTMFGAIPASLANSSGIFLGSAAHGDLVRPGAALFGINPTPDRPNPMRQAVGLKGRIVQVRKIARGATVGYGATWAAAEDSRIAIVAVGYGDGYLRASAALSGDRPVAIVAGKRCPVVGRISMDLLALDVSALPEQVVQRGHFATLLGEGIDIDELARFGGLIGYEVLTSLGRRYHRVWKARA